ncbi:hypothetical protein [Picrophilus oshimae]|uniref:Thiaminase n=1 Tax=Picrophilus torridus (strain ATCC 700027 / DSM 9790 / JCM 10055 / NBRC 100828 / KAW 2/3) TaxID=1122961 RepID=A0A8G2FVP8_PICTO|nr:hypothetical protein [Picrophilus oshimae]SMD30346.1 Thiaminase [Picrophilus oshimae DSM 9789]
MNNSDFLVNKSDFKRALNTEFSRLFIENRITERSLIDYFEQDYFFVLEDLKVLKKLIELSEDKNMFSWFMSLINNDELNFFNRFFYENNIDIKKIEISKTTRKYIDYMESIIEKDDFILILSMLLAGEWIYLETFSGKNSKNIYIGEWEKIQTILKDLLIS